MIIVVLSNTRWKRSEKRFVAFLLANKFTGIFRHSRTLVRIPLKFKPSSIIINSHNPNLSKTYSNKDTDKVTDNISENSTVTTHYVKSHIVFRKYLLPS